MRLLLPAVAAFALAGCAHQQVVDVGGGVDQRLADRGEARVQAACPIRLVDLVDGRIHGDAAGAVVGIDARLPGALAIVEDELRRAGVARDAAGPPAVRIVLKKLYLAAINITKSPTAVLVFTGDDGREQLVRAQDTTINWNGTQAEYERAMTRVIGRAVDDLVARASEGCPAAAR